MKRKINILFMCAAFCVICVAAPNVCAQNSRGGYKTIPLTDAMVLEAADVAVAAHNSEGEVIYDLSAIQSAERQTVQGTNYRLCLRIIAEDAEFDTDYEYARVVVFRSLDGDFDLKSWTEVKNCGK